MKYRYSLFLVLLLLFLGSYQPIALAQNCAIPSSGPWPPCAAGGGSTADQPAPLERIYQTPIVQDEQPSYYGSFSTLSTYGPQISDNGRWVTFFDDYMYTDQVIIYRSKGLSLLDAQSGETKGIVSEGADTGSQNFIIHAALASNGQFVAFSSAKSEVVANDTGRWQDVFIYDIATAAKRAISVSPTGELGNGGSTLLGLSADNRLVVFESSASNLVAGDNNGRRDTFVHDLTTGNTRIMGANEDPASIVREQDVSADGRFVAFADENSLVPNDTNNLSDVFVRDTVTNNVQRVSVSETGEERSYASAGAAISGNGKFVVFMSGAGIYKVGNPLAFANAGSTPSVNLVTCAEITQITAQECQSLQELYNEGVGREGPASVQWFTSTTPCLWGRGNDLAHEIDVVGCQFNDGVGHVESLYLRSDFTLSNMPDDLDWLTELTIESNNLITYIPFLGNLSRLQKVTLHQLPQLWSIPQFGFDSRHNHSLTHLILDNLPNLTEMTTNFATMPNLELASFWNMPNLKYVASSLGELSKLDVLVFGRLGVTTLPSELGNLSNLTWLQITDNPNLQSVPAELGNLKALRRLTVANNPQLRSVPATMDRSNYQPQIDYYVDVPVEAGAEDGIENPATGTGDCTIPPSGPWPPCATAGDTPPAALPNGCVIPSRGPWPPCATNGAPGSPSACVIPTSGPWPACATTGDAPPADLPGECVIPPRGPWPACAVGR